MGTRWEDVDKLQGELAYSSTECQQAIAGTRESGRRAPLPVDGIQLRTTSDPIDCSPIQISP